MVKTKCYICGETNPDNFFNDKSRSSGLSSRCKMCCRKETRKKIAFRQPFLASLKVRGCAVCGEKDIAVLEFHHANPAKRSFSVASIGQRTGWNKYFDEVAKCILLCANCHKRAHFYSWNLSSLHQFDRQEVKDVFDRLWNEGREAP